MQWEDKVSCGTLPGQCPSAGRQDSQSTTPAVIIYLGIGRPVSQPKWRHQIPCKPSRPN